MGGGGRKDDDETEYQRCNPLPRRCHSIGRWTYQGIPPWLAIDSLSCHRRPRPDPAFTGWNATGRHGLTVGGRGEVTSACDLDRRL